MSDTDNESAFESADEGEDDIGHRHPAVRQPSPSAVNQGTSSFQAATQHDEHDDTSGLSSDSESALPRIEDGPNEHQARECAIINETVALAGTSGLQQSGDDWNLRQVDEGLGDWDTGWEVDEDVLGIDSSSIGAGVVTVMEKCEDQREASREKVDPAIGNIGSIERSSSSGDGDGESQMKEDTPMRQIEKSANKERVLDKLCEASGQRQSQTSGWGWGSWGTSILSSATASVSTFTTQVGHGLNSVLGSVEATLGAPTPEELAAQQSAKEKIQEPLVGGMSAIASEQNVQSQSFLGTPLAMSVGNISSKVIAGSLDTLELIGRKTMDILQEGDPGFKKKRSFLKAEKPVLSEVLREAKERESETSLTDENPGEHKINFGTIFDDCQGFVHLEALEMLSKQSEQRIQVGLLSVIDEELTDMQRSLENIKETYESQTDIDTEENLEQEFDKLLTQHLKGLNVVVNLEKLFKVQCDSQTWLQQCSTEQDKGEIKGAKDIHAKAIHFMAEFTARAVEVIHKMSELTLVMHDVDVSQCIQSFASFANVVCTEVSIQSSKYSSCLSTSADDSEDPDSVNPLITNVFLEASNSSTYIQDACHLLIPIFQLKIISSVNDKEA